MRTMCSRQIFTRKCWQQQIFDSDLKGAWHYNHVTFTPIAKNFMLYCRLIYMLSILCVRLTIKVKVGIPESFKVGWYSLKKTGSSHLNSHSLNSKQVQNFFIHRQFVISLQWNFILSLVCLATRSFVSILLAKTEKITKHSTLKFVLIPMTMTSPMTPLLNTFCDFEGG